MVERKHYKTKICQLYQRGRCPRQYCNFAHGSAELRRSSFNGRQETRGGGDLRERLDRIRSPSHKSSARGDPEARNSFHGDSPRSLEKRSERNHRKIKQLDGHTGYSERMSDGDEGRKRDSRRTSSDAKVRIDEQLRETHTEIENLERDKRHLEMCLDDKIKEEDTLTSKMHELEMQLSKENEEAKRLNEKIKKFIKAHNRHLRLQDELKRSHAELQKLGEQLDSDAEGLGIEDDSQINTVNDRINGVSSPFNEVPHRKRPRLLIEEHDASTQVNERTRVEKLSRRSGHHNLMSNSKKAEAEVDAYNEPKLSAYEDRSRRGIKQPADTVASAEKHKSTDTGLTLPSTGIAAHAMDEDAEALDADDNRGAGAASTQAELKPRSKFSSVPFPPPPLPPIPPNVYSQYNGDDENVDIDGLDEVVDTV
ncbi:Zinc finger CCCH domain-containing protein 40 [Striga hermonthica]|uniref:Zinc finger CCCH domain-containing protein 40 n=1 Tax=Striga hermonthica TaxID=68872 RepID=A0A9N7R6P3_STRHE|nr:Zinc finger CCCH domain-containing protein 40 [Striga hermonthica]